MSTTIMYLYHHGDFTPPPNITYVGGLVEVIKDFDCDTLSFRDLEEFAEKYSYDPNSLIYFKCDGHSFKRGTRLIYDDDSVRDLCSLCKPYGRIELFVDHFELDELIDVPHTPKQIKQTNKSTEKMVETETLGDACEGGDDDVGVNDEFSDDSDDPEYAYGSEIEESDEDSLVPDEYGSDDEMYSIRQNCKKFKEGMYNAMNIPTQSPSQESVCDSQILRSMSSSSEDENAIIGYVGPPNPKRRRILQKNGSTDGVPQWEVGQKFVNMAEFRDTVRRYGVIDRRGVQFVTNDSRRCQVTCEGDCPFYIWCSRDKNSESCTIKTLVDNHLCTKPYRNKLASVKYLCELFGERIRKNPQWMCKEMAETIKNELEIEVPRIKILRLRKMALEGIAESLKEHYSRVRDFGQEVLLSNPHNTVKISTTRMNENDPVKLKRIYVCYFALKAGWKAGCRPFIGLDGCFLKTVTGGQLLSAVGRDGNNQMFPICYAVVESENTDSWMWFLTILKDDLDLGDGSGFTVISDQQKGLERAVKKLLPSVEHRFCTRHLCANFKKRFNTSILKNSFWNIATATYKVAYTRAMKEMEKHSKSAHAQLAALDPKQWCKAFFATHSKVDNTDNNMSESFNSWIINERYMPLLTMLQEIHFKLMKRMRNKRDEMLSTDQQICPKIKKYLDMLITESRKWDAAWDGERKFQVKQGTRSVTVDLEKGNCDCRVYDLTGIPCQHAIAAIHSRRHHPSDYVSEYYKREKYLETYKHSLEAMKGEDYWDFHGGEEMLPPDIPKKLRGRPKKMRRREEWEGGSRSQSQPSQGVILQRFSNKRVMHCSNYREEGHRVSKCPTRPQRGNAETRVDNADPGGGNAQKEKQVPKKKSAKEMKRQKLFVKRKGVAINELSPTQASQTNPTVSKVKGKKKVVEEAYAQYEQPPPSVVEDGDNDVKGHEDIAAMINEAEANNAGQAQLEEGNIGGKTHEEKAVEDPLSFLKTIPRKKMPLLKGDTDEWPKSGKNYAQFQQKLRGPIGYQAFFF